VSSCSGNLIAQLAMTEGQGRSVSKHPLAILSVSPVYAVRFFNARVSMAVKAGRAGKRSLAQLFAGALEDHQALQGVCAQSSHRAAAGPGHRVSAGSHKLLPIPGECSNPRTSFNTCRYSNSLLVFHNFSFDWALGNMYNGICAAVRMRAFIAVSRYEVQCWQGSQIWAKSESRWRLPSPAIGMHILGRRQSKTSSTE
jgi:hypothetical protein